MSSVEAIIAREYCPTAATHLLEDILDRHDNRVLPSSHAVAKSTRAPDSDAIAACSKNFRWRINLDIIGKEIQNHFISSLVLREEMTWSIINE